MASNSKFLRSQSFNTQDLGLPLNSISHTTAPLVQQNYSSKNSIPGNFYSQQNLLVNSNALPQTPQYHPYNPLQQTMISSKAGTHKNSKMSISGGPKDFSRTMVNNVSEPNLSNYDQFQPGYGNQTISISNQYGDNRHNSIVLKSSFSDQNLININNENYDSGFYQQNLMIQNNNSRQNICISNQNYQDDCQMEPSFHNNQMTLSCGPSFNFSQTHKEQPHRSQQLLSQQDNLTINGSNFHEPFQPINFPAAFSPKPTRSTCGNTPIYESCMPSTFDQLSRLNLSSVPVEQFEPQTVSNYPSENLSSLNRSQSLITDDHIIDLEYDSDTGWKTKKVRENNFNMKKKFKSRYTSIPVKQPFLDRSLLTLNVVKNIEDDEFDGPTKKSMSDNESSTRLSRSHRPKNHRKDRLERLKGEGVQSMYSSNDSIKSIIDEVRCGKVSRPTPNAYLSDESTKDRNRQPHNVKRLQIKNLTENVKYFEKKKDTNVVVTKRGEKCSDIGEESESGMFTKCKLDESNSKKESCENGEKLRSGNYDDVEDDEKTIMSDGSDDVFETPFSRDRNSSFNGKSRKTSRFAQRRTSSLDALPIYQSESRYQDRCSSVSINDKPEYFEYDRSPFSPEQSNAPSSSFANKSSFNFSNSSTSSVNGGIAPLGTNPKRGSLKKTPSSLYNNSKTKIDNTKPNTRIPVPRQQKRKPNANKSEYDVRDQRRHQGGGGGGGSHQLGSSRERDAYSDRDRDSSDRDQKDHSRGSSFNRSISNSNTDGTQEDKIGKQNYRYVSFN